MQDFYCSINWPDDDPFIILRQAQVDFCEGNKCAALLMSFFESQHDFKTKDPGLSTPYTEQQLRDGILKLRGKKTIRPALRYLEKRGVITVSFNPRFKFDRTRYFEFNPEIINDYLNLKD